MLNDQTFESLPVKAGVSQGFILRSLFFLIHVNDLLDNLLSTVNFFVDDASSVVNDSNISVNELNEDLQKISDNQ